MADKSAIEWTIATWNIVTGCDKVSPGCRNCYAERFALRLQKMGTKKYINGFKLTIHDDKIDFPLQINDPRMVFDVI
jgi:protein gp37